VFGLLGVNQASAVEAYAPTAAELALLPLSCQAKLKNSNPTDIKLYSAKIGPDWLHFHHYCLALNYSNRYTRSFANKTDQLFYLQSAMSNFDYIFNHSSPAFWMRPVMHLQKGNLLLAAKRNIEAVNEFEKALQDNPNYIEAYAALGDLYKNTGEKLKSITAVEQALERAPNNKSLQRQYNQLTGKNFTPSPPKVEQAAQPPSTPIPVGQAAATSAVSSTTTLPVPTSSPVAIPEKIGTPTNPYCRFCPPE